jgi:transcriptional regulator GlxA family with amidase domain
MIMTSKKKVLLFIYNGFADKEVSHLLSNIVKSCRYDVKTIAIDKTVKQSLSGLSVVPDFDFLPQVDLKDIDESNTALFILPGGEGWQEKLNFEISPLIKHCVKCGITVAASGESTLLLADLGLLDKTHHTSVSAEYLNTFSFAYNGHDKYINDSSVCHHGMVTACGQDAVDFSNAVLKVLDLKNQIEQSYYEELMFE